MYFENLDGPTRAAMVEELERDLTQETLYLSPRLSETGLESYEHLLRQAIENYDDQWLAHQLRLHGCISLQERRRNPRGGYTLAKTPNNAAETLAEGEFNRFYIRGLCIRALRDGISEVEVCRGKMVANPRPQSTMLIGRRISAQSLLNDLRQATGIEPALGVPPGPNSGLTVRLPLASGDSKPI